MTKLLWDQVTDKHYIFGIDRGVLYPKKSPGVAWSGLIDVSETIPKSINSLYFEAVKQFDLVDQDQLSFAVEAYTYPDELNVNDIYGFSYRIKYDLGYRIHLIYNARFNSSDDSSTTDTDKINPNTFSWDIVAQETIVPGAKPNAHLIIDSNLVLPADLALLESQLYGDESIDAYLPTATAITEIFKSTGFVIIDNGNGTWTAIGPDSAIVMLDAITFQITWPSTTVVDTNTYTISST